MTSLGGERGGGRWYAQAERLGPIATENGEDECTNGAVQTLCVTQTEPQNPQP